ncbi:MAG: heme exporter protein CcmD [Pseudomonadota bacterium]
MPDLGKYAAEVLSAYGVSLALLGFIVVLSVVQAKLTRRRLDAAQARRTQARATGQSARNDAQGATTRTAEVTEGAADG